MFADRVDALISEHGMTFVVKVMQAGVAHFLDSEYYEIVMANLSEGRFRTFLSAVAGRLVALKEFIPRYITKTVNIQKDLQEPP